MGASVISMHHRRLFFVKENFAEQRQSRECNEHLIRGRKISKIINSNNKNAANQGGKCVFYGNFHFFLA